MEGGLLRRQSRLTMGALVMAGKRHHIIPKFLQKGFASREEGDTVWTWLYHKNIAEPREISTKDTLVSEYFYGKGEESADDEITEFETTRLAPLVDALRDGRCEARDGQQEIAGLVAHLSIRTKLIRKGFQEVSEKFLGGLGKILGDGELMGNAIGNQPDSYLKEQFDEVLSGPELYPGSQDAFEQLERLGVSRNKLSSFIVTLMRQNLDDPKTRQELGDGIGEFFNQFFDASSTLVTDSIKTGHINSLKKSVAPEARIQVFEQFGWSIQECDFDLILGDSATIFESVRRDTFVPFCDLVDMKTVLLPISTRQLLIGSQDPGVQITVTDNINQALARCSYEQFVASTNTHTALIDRIGLERLPKGDAEIDAELNEIRENMKKMGEIDEYGSC